MTHEEFVRLAETAARNAQGLRPLAGHVRRLYGVIRALQEDDNSFAYIAEIIQQVRNDRTDAFSFTDRVKTYYHRDRKAVGDPPVTRRMRRSGAGAVNLVREEASPGRAPAPDLSRGDTVGPEDVEAEIASEAPSTAPKGGEGAPDPAAPGNKNAAPDELRALTAALHNRPGRRRVVAGG